MQVSFEIPLFCRELMRVFRCPGFQARSEDDEGRFRFSDKW